MEIQSLIILNHDSYVPEPWHGTFIVIAVALFCAIFNTFLARKLPLVEGSVLILHILGFFAILIPLWIMAPRASARAVFTEFSVRSNGWSNTGLACLVSILWPTVSLLGSDAATHMSEELQDASYVLPRAMIATAAINGTLGFAMLVTFCFCLGDVEAVMGSKIGQFGYAFIEVFRQGTQSVAGATAMTCILIILSTFCCVTNIATSSRQLFAFARDNGVPFSAFFAYVSSGRSLHDFH
jgi:amino acid transporter